MDEMDFTRKFRLGDQRDLEIKAILTTVYQALQEKGYNPVNQIVGYILSEDPTYITNHNNARALIRKVDRDELLQTLVKYYLTHSQQIEGPLQGAAGPFLMLGKGRDRWIFWSVPACWGLSAGTTGPPGPAGSWRGWRCWGTG